MKKIKKLLIITLLTLPLLFGFGISGWVILNVKEDEAPPTYNYETILENAYGGQAKTYSGEGLAPIPTYDDIQKSDMIASGDSEIKLEYRIKDSGDEWSSEPPKNNGEYEVRITNVVAQNMGVTEPYVYVTFTIQKAEQVITYSGLLLKTYDGEALEFLEEKLVGDSVMSCSNKYTITGTNGKSLTNVGSSDITVVATPLSDGNFLETTFNWTISVTEKNIQHADVSKEVTTKYTYTGQELKPSYSDIKITYNDMILTSSDYEITGYENNKEVGTGKVKIKGIGNYNGTATIEFAIEKAPLVVELSSSNIYTRYENPIDITITTVDNTTISNENIGIKYFDEEKQEINYIPTIAGSYYVQVTIPESSNFKAYNSGLVSYTITPKSITELQYDTITDVQYTGSEITRPLPVITFDEYTLLNNTDYTLAYTDANKNVITSIVDAGSYFVKVTGIGNYSEDLYIPFKVVKHSIGSVTIDIPNQTYTGEALVPDITITDANDNPLVEGTDYEVVLGTYINANTYTITIYGMELYEGNTSATFTIDKAELTDANVSGLDNLVYNGLVQTINPVITFNEMNITGFTYTIKNNEEVKDAKIYTLVVTPTDPNFKDTPFEVQFTVNDADVEDLTFSVTDNVYNATNQEPVVTIENIDSSNYTVTYDYTEFINVGTYTLTITGINNLTGTTTIEYHITKLSIENATIDYVKDQYYTGSQITPEITVSYKDITLFNIDDYTITYGTNNELGENKGSITITATDSSNFSGSQTVYFNISKQSIEDATITGYETEIEYTGHAYKPILTLTMGEKPLTEGTDYTVTYSEDIINAGQTSVITITGIGIYSGSTTINVEIIKANIKDDLSFENFETKYTGTIYNIQVLYKDTSLPAGVTATYTVDDKPFSGTATAGTYLITATFDVDSNYEPIETMTATLTITKATYDMNGVVFNSLEFKYDKQTHSLEATGMPDGVTVSYENNGQINVGTYTVIAKFKGDEVNYNAIPNKEATLIITKHTPELIINEVSINRDYLADLLLGNNYQVNNNLDNTKVTEVIKNSNDEIVEETLVVGTYTVTITVTGNNNQEEVSKSFTLIINKINPNYTIPSGLTAIYGDYLSEVSLSEYPGWAWESNIQLLEVGTKYYKATYTPTDTDNYNIITGIDVPVQVAKATLTGIKFDSQTIPYDTESHTITITGTLPTGVGVKYYYKGTTTEFKGETNVGAYEITAVITDSLGNYSELTLDATLTIEQSMDPAYKEQTNIDASYGQTLEDVKNQLLNNWSFKDALTTSVGNAGEHEFTVIYTPTNNNYQKVEKTIKIIVAKIAPTFTVEDLEHVYNGSKLEATISHNSDGANFEYYYCLVGTTTQIDPINVGTYDIYVSISEGNNYTAVSDQKLNKQLVINKYTLTDEKVQFVDIPNQEYTGSPIEPEITVTLKDTTVKFDNTCYTVSYTDNTALGTATVTITGKDNFDGSATTVFVITQGGISDSSITEISDIVYTGKEVEYELVVTVNGKVLTKDTDYIVTVTGDTINVGTVTIEVEGIGNYTGTGSTTFEITPKSIDGGQAIIEGSLAYNGSAITPITSVTLEGYTGVTYDEISYENNENAGTASYTINGNGNYTGTITGTFEITKATPVITVPTGIIEITYGDTFDASAYYEVSNNFDAAISSEVTLDGTEVTNLIVGEYVVYVSVTENDNVFGATKSFTLKVNPKEVVKPTKGDTVYTYNGTEQTFTETSFTNELIKVSGNKGTNVGSYTVTIELADKANYIWKETQNSDNYTLTYEIVAFDLNNLLDSQIAINGDLTYTSKQITPTVTITFAGDTLSNTLYDLTYGTNINVADGGIITISSLSDNFTGTRPVSFTIKQLDVKDATVTVSDQQYTGSALEPQPTVSIDSIGQLQLTTDYTLSYSGTHTNVSDSPVTITVTGTGNYTGNKTTTFNITPIDISGATVGEIQDQNYTGDSIEPKPIIYIKGNVLPEGNYEVTYSNHTAVGTATITIKGIGNYTGTITKTFNIIDSIASADVYFETTVNEVGPFTYTGNEIKPTVIKVVINGVTLVENTDYKVTYENNINANKGENIPKVIITPKEGSGYTGSKVIEFTINKAAQTINSIDSYSKPYDGISYSFEATSSVGNGITYTLDGKEFTGVTNVGTHIVTVTAAESDNYLEATKDVEIIISSIDPKFVVSNNEYTYDGAGHQATVESSTETAYAGYNGTITIIYRLNGEKVETPTNAGNYDIYVTATAGTNWNAITEEQHVGTLTINKQKVDKPTENTNDFTYDKSEQTYEPNNYNEDTMNITNNIQTTANETGYTVTVSLENTNNYIWSDGTSEDITFTFVIKKADPTVETPTNLNGSYDALLSTVTLPDGWTWNTPNAKLDKLGSMSFTATYIPTDKTNYNIIEKPLTVSVSSTSISGAIVSGYETSIQYSGTLYQPDTIVVTLNGKGLNPETDYTINYGDVVNVGTQTIIITGKNNYSGEVKVNVTITPKELSVPTIKGTYTYNKLTQTFALEGYDSSTMTVTNNTGTNAGNYTVKVSLNDTTNYTWVIGETKTNVTQELPVTIAQRGIAELEFSVLVEKPYTGGQITQDYSVTYGDYTLLKGTDYEENYGYADDYFGTVTITVTGKGNYTGTKELTFSIVQADQEIDTTNMTKVFTYDTTAQLLSGATSKTNIKYYLGNVEITSLTDAGTYTITIKAASNKYYKEATTSETVVVNKAKQVLDISDYIVTYKYTGEAITFANPGAFENPEFTFIVDGETLLGNTYTFESVKTYTLVIKSSATDNYLEGQTATITITVDKGVLKYTGDTLFTATYGDLLSSVNLNNEYLSWVTPTDSVGDAGTRKHQAIYNTNKDLYEDCPVEMTITVNPKQVSKPTLPDTTYTYDGGNDITLIPAGYDANTMVLSNNVQTTAGVHSVIVSLVNNNYVWTDNTSDQVTINFTINKATPTYETPSNLEGVYGNKLSSVSLSSWTGWSWDDGTIVLDTLDEHKYSATFTPDDTVNYNTVTLDLTVNVVAPKTQFTVTFNDNITVDYDGNTHALGYTVTGIDESDITVNVTYKKNGVVSISGAPVDAGQYVAYLTVTYNENLYEMTNTPANGSVIINKATPTPTTPTNLVGTLGDTLSLVSLTTWTGWSWDDGTTVLNTLGEHSYSATFTPDDTENYNTVTLDLTVKVVKLISGATVTGYVASIEYSGSVYKPTLTVVHDGEELNLNTHYTVNYGDVYLAGNTQTIIIEGIGDYQGELAVYVEINKADITEDLEFNDVTVTYDGTTHNINVKYKETTTLPQGVTVVYTVNNTEFKGASQAGTYVIIATLTGNANFEEIPSMEATLKIDKANPSISGLVLTSILQGYSTSVKNKGTITGVSGETLNGDYIFIDDCNLELTFDDSSTSNITSKTLKLKFTPYPQYQVNYNSIEVEATVNIYAVASINYSNYYGTIEEAVKSATSNQVVYVEPISKLSETGLTPKLFEDCTIPSGIRLHLPYEDKNTSEYTTSTSTVPKESKELVISTLLIPEDITLTIEGTLTVAALTYSSGTVSYRGVLMNNGNIIVNNGGTLHVYGYLKGQGNIDALNGSNIEDIFKIHDWTGGQNAYALNNDKILPFKCYSIHNISCSLTLNTGCIYSSLVIINLSDEWYVKNVVLVGSGGLFTLSSGYIVKSVEDTTKVTDMNSSIYTSNQDITQRDILEINGDFVDGSMKIELKLGGRLPVNIATGTDMAMPIGFFKIYLMSGTGTLSNNSYQFLPGSELFIAEGATLNISSDVHIGFYDEFPDDFSYIHGSTTTSGASCTYSYQNKHSHIYDDGNVKPEYYSKLIVNGYLNCEGYLGGFVSSTGNGKVYIANTNASFKTIDTLEYAGTSINLIITTISLSKLTLGENYSLNAYGTINNIPDTNFTSATTYYYGSTIQSWGTPITINFVTNNENEIDSLNINYGSAGYLITEEWLLNRIGSKDHYSLEGWYFDSSFSNKYDYTSLTTDTTLHAKWQIDRFTITFMDGDEVYAVKTFDYGAAIILPDNPTKDGWVFSGWSFLNDNTTDTLPSTMPDDDLNLYAVWGSQQFVITYIDGELSETSDAILEGTSITLPNLSKTNYIFDGWYTASEGGVKVGSGGQSYAPTSNITLYARWLPMYEIIYHYNGTTSTIEVEQGKSTTLINPSSKAGYEFTGWYTSETDGNFIGNTGDSYIPTNSIELYAQWVAYIVSFDANGGTCDIVSDSVGANNYITLPTPTRNGYYFIGWYTASTGGTKIGNAGASYTPTSDITLFAQWNEKFTVSYNANGGSSSTTTQSYEGTALTLPTPTRTGYKFNGWYTALSGGTKIGDAGASYTPTGNITLYAQWTGYKVTYNANGGSVSPTSATYNGTALTLPTPTRTGYTFNGWYTAASGGTKVGAAGASYTPNSDITLYAQWTQESSGGCVIEGTLITLADGTKLPVENIMPGDLLIVFNHETGKYEIAEVLFNDSEESSTYTFINLEFSNGSKVKVAYEHGFFDLDLMKYVYIDEYNYMEFVGHEFVASTYVDGEIVQTRVILDKAYLTYEYARIYSPVTKYHLNYLTEDILSMPGGISGLFNIFEYDESLQYNEELMEKDIEEYGLLTYEDFADLVTYEVYCSFPAQYFSVAIGKGLLTWDYVQYLIERYVPLM